MLLPLVVRPRLSDARPWATWTAAAVLGLVHAARLAPGLLPPAWAGWEARAALPADGGSASALLTHLLVHGDLLHLGLNLLFLLVFGPNVERRLGAPRFVLLLLLAGAAGGLAFVAAETEGALGGASGSVLGVLAFSALALRGQRVLLLAWVLVVWAGELPAWVLALLLLALDLAVLLGGGVGGGRVAVPAHLGGLAAGALAALAARGPDALHGPRPPGPGRAPAT